MCTQILNKYDILMHNYLQQDSAKASKRPGTFVSPTTRPHADRAASQPVNYERHTQAKLSKSRSRPGPQTRRPDTTITNAHATLGTDTSIATGGSKFTRLAKTLAKEIEASHRWAQAPSVKGSPEKKSRKILCMYLIPYSAYLLIHFLSSGKNKTDSNATC